MSFRHLWAVIRKELQHILRDRGTFILVLVTPTLVLLLMTYSLAVKIQHVPIALLDYDQSATSREFIHQITAGDDLDLYQNAASMAEIEELLVKGKIKAAIIIGPEFSEDLLAMRGLSLQIIIDGTEPETGGSGEGLRVLARIISCRLKKEARDGSPYINRKRPLKPPENKREKDCDAG